MPRPPTLLLCGLLLAAVAGPAGCVPANPLAEGLDRLPADVQPVVRDAVWAHGNPYVWAAQENMVLEVLWSDYRHGYKPINSRKVYTIDLRGRGMRIDDEAAQTSSLFDGSRWRVFIHGQEIKLPDRVTAETAPYFASFEYAAGEMRSARMFFELPFNLLDDGLTLKSCGRVQTSGESNVWNVLKATFDPAVTGHFKDDSMLLYFDLASKRIDRILFSFADAPFHGIAHWGEWSEYRRLTNGLIMARRLDFRMTDDQGAADLGRRLTLVVNKVACNVKLPAGVFDTLAAKPGAIDDMTEGAGAAPPKTIGRDAPGLDSK